MREVKKDGGRRYGERGEKRLSGIVVLMVLNSVNNSAALPRPRMPFARLLFRMAKQGSWLQPGGL